MVQLLNLYSWFNIKIMSSIGKDIDCQDHAFERIQITHPPRVHSILGELSTRCHSRLSYSSPLFFFLRLYFLEYSHNYAVAAGKSIKSNATGSREN